MEDQPSAAEPGEQTDADGKWMPVKAQRARTQKEHERSTNRLKRASRWIGRPFKYVIKKLDEHNGAVTAAATIVIAGLTYFIATDGRQQMTAIRGQLEEMKKQRISTMAQSRANVRQERSSIRITKQDGNVAAIGEQVPIAQVAGWIISPRWINAGNTDARDWRAWFDLKSFARPASPYTVTKKDCPPAVAPDPLPDGLAIPNGSERLEYAKNLSLEDAVAQTKGDRFILIWGHMEYRDIFYPETIQHYFDWCEGIAVNDFIPDDFSFISLSEKSQ